MSSIANSILICLLFWCGLCFALDVSVIDKKYPSHGEERKFIEHVFEQNSSENFIDQDQLVEIMRSKLRDELKRKENKISSTIITNKLDQMHELRIVQLIKHYLDLSDINEANCDNANPEDLLNLLKLHSDSPQSKVYEYLHEIAKKQFAICGQLWNRILYAQVHDSIDNKTQEKMTWLLDTLITTSSKATKPYGSHYSKTQLARICSRPPIAGLVLYISRFDGLIPDLDDNFHSPNLKKDQLQVAMKRSIAPLCRPVCQTLSSITQQLQLLYQYRTLEAEYQKLLQQMQQANVGLLSSLLRGVAPSSPKSKQQESKTDASEYIAAKWLAGKIVCCKLIASLADGTLLNQLYDELTKQPEAYIEDAKEQELNFAELIAQHGYRKVI